MQSILNKTRISRLLCSAVLVASPALAQGVGASIGAGAAPSPLAGAPGTGIGANAGVGATTSPLAGAPGTGLGANARAGAGMSTTTTGTLNSNAAANANGATPSTTAGLGASNSAGVTTVPGGLSANGNVTGNAGLDSQQTPASRLAQQSQANANAVRTAPSLNQQTTTSGQAAATANGTVPAQ